MKSVEDVLADFLETDPQVDAIDSDPRHRDPVHRLIASLKDAGYEITNADRLHELELLALTSYD